MTATVFLNRRRGAPFRSRVEAHSLAKRYWICDHCLYSLEGKFVVCPECGCTVVRYFQSRKERNRFATLRQMQSYGHISELAVHPVYPLHAPDPGGQLVEIARYIADFRYRKGGELIVEDVKASDARESLDPVFRHKRKHFEAQYALPIHTYA